MKKVKRSKVSKISSYIWDLFFIIVAVPVLLCSIMIICKTLVNPTEIPDVFGYKIFIVFDENMDKSLEYGDVVITKNANPEEIKLGDLVAYNNNNYVTIHKVTDISKKDDTITYTVNINKGEVGSATHITKDKIEGVLEKQYHGLGYILIFMQDIRGLIIMISVILIIGVISYYVAERMDKKEDVEDGKIKDETKNETNKEIKNNTENDTKKNTKSTTKKTTNDVKDKKTKTSTKTSTKASTKTNTKK